MPLYEYECKSCENRFEKIQKFSDPLVTQCPKCGKETVEQMISAPAFQFKGSGWYVSDYGNKKAGGDNQGKDGEKPATSAEGKNEGKGDSKAGSKPQAKTETSSSANESSTATVSSSSSSESK